MTNTGSSSPPDPGRIDGVPRSGDEVRAVLRAIGVRPRRGWGQSFLIDPFVADAEAALATDGDPGRIVEIGGGLGVLTEALLRRATAPVTVIERDRHLAGHLRRVFGGRIRLVVGDALEVELPPADVVVGNLPFSVATPILDRLFDAGTPRIVAMVQREVADRLGAGPGSKAYGRLTLHAALFGRIETHQVVPATAFEPEPEVEGRLVTFDRRRGPPPVPSTATFERLVFALFAHRRKQLGNLLPSAVGSPAEAARVAALAGWPADWSHRRPEELPPQAYFDLATVVAHGAAAAQV